MKSLDFISEAKTQIIGYRQWVRDGQDVWEIIRPDGKIEVAPRRYFEQLPRDVEYVAWNTALQCPPGFSCAPQANGQPAPKQGDPAVSTPSTTAANTPSVSVSGSSPAPAPMSKAHIDIAAKRQGAPSSQQTPTTRGTSNTPTTAGTAPAPKYAGSAGAQAIQKLNPSIKDVNRIYVGQELVMPDGSKYKVAAGDTLDKIAAKQNRRPVEPEMSEPYRDFADIKKDSSKLLAESSNLSPVEKIQHLRSLLEAPAPNPQRASMSPILGPDGKPLPSTATKPPASAALGKLDISKELFHNDKLYRKMGTTWYEINLSTGARTPVPGMAADLEKLAAAPKQPLSPATPQGSIKQGIKTAGTGAATPPAGASPQYYDDLYAVARGENPKAGRGPHIGWDELDKKGIRVDADEAALKRKQLDATRDGIKNEVVKNFMRMPWYGKLASLAVAASTAEGVASIFGTSLMDLFSRAKDYIKQTEVYQQTVGTPVSEEDQLTKEMTEIFQRKAGPYLNDPEAFLRLPPREQSDILKVVQAYLQVMQDPTGAQVNLPPHLRPRVIVN